MAKFVCKPQDIDVTVYIFGTFNNIYCDAAATWIIRFLQHLGKTWRPFTHTQIQEYYSRVKEGHMHFASLILENYIVEEDGLFFVTPEFVRQCYSKYPKEKNLADSP